jgi:predicted TPR repeat methyltransferase
MTDPEILEPCARGEISPHIALSRLLLTGRRLDVAQLAQEAAARPDAPRLAALADLAERHRDRLDALGRLARSGLWPEGEDVRAATAALFDRLAEEAPEAGVAFYAFGDPTELEAATAELTGIIRAWAPTTGRRIVDYGCGTGRVAIALAQEAGMVLGLDISAGMIAEARRRAGSRPNLAFAQNAGGLCPVADGASDLLVAVDSLPYVVQADALESFMADAARVLGAGGDLLVFNWSYRSDPQRDMAEAHALAAAHGFAVLRAGEHPFTIWDGTGFHLRRHP